jgi:hypothetical protein
MSASTGTSRTAPPWRSVESTIKSLTSTTKTPASSRANGSSGKKIVKVTGSLLVYRRNIQNFLSRVRRVGTSCDYLAKGPVIECTLLITMMAGKDFQESW